MNKNTSIYLDILRAFSALGVLLSHVSMPFFSDLNICSLYFGHRMVVVFFVLSGFLIAYTTELKHKNFNGYLVDRISRLYSVIIPALILTCIVDEIGVALHPDFYSQFNITGSLAYYFKYVITFLNLHEIWFFSAKPPTNGPFWSLSYEFWYYILFGIAMFIQGYRKYIALLFICLITGYKILLLLPVWLLGVLCYHASKKTIPQSVAIGGYVLSFVVLAGIISGFIHSVFPTFDLMDKHFYYSFDFLNDFVLGIVLLIHILCINSISFNLLSDKSFFVQKIKWFSSITFSLYLFHFPLLVFFASFGFYNKSSEIQVLSVVLVIIVLIVVISNFTEQKRFLFKEYFGKIYYKMLPNKYH